MNILHIDSACLGDNSASRQLTAAIVDALRVRHWDANVAYRDLGAGHLPHVTGPLLQVMRGQWNSTIPLNEDLQGDVMLTELLLAEFMVADVIVLGAPVLTLSVPSTLKAWLDRVVLEGRTYKVSPSGRTIGLATGKRAIVASTRGGPTLAGMSDYHTGYLKAVFAMVGITDVHILEADNLAQGTAAREQAIEAALQQAALLAA
ncbi:FMN-dependent NADH-azoreductase [Pseudoduganella ginsengisoli]|uniref:FMN dependent NADH:quinone oxidoreductase n=1 Tax=Pseudoduganella ginsengisoli TaxID=1462440 RepID=A0A6L6PX02_9BURK|nr:NAD(P)H-dependent oxidoreductase [Pseudoduganella ginsengisoli]MTW02123.1 FMN-dependent NADH-azoreductase [Pseudoduganella ginsengisoli]